MWWRDPEWLLWCCSIFKKMSRSNQTDWHCSSGPTCCANHVLPLHHVGVAFVELPNALAWQTAVVKLQDMPNLHCQSGNLIAPPVLNLHQAVAAAHICAIQSGADRPGLNVQHQGGVTGITLIRVGWILLSGGKEWEDEDWTTRFPDSRRIAVLSDQTRGHWGLWLDWGFSWTHSSRQTSLWTELFHCAESVFQTPPSQGDPDLSYHTIRERLIQFGAPQREAENEQCFQVLSTC